MPSFSADLNPELIEEEKKKAKESRRHSVISSLLRAEKEKVKYRKPKDLDRSYQDELRRLELAEERRKRQMEMLERIKNRRMSEFAQQNDDGSPHFEDCEYKPLRCFQHHQLERFYCLAFYSTTPPKNICDLQYFIRNFFSFLF